MTVDDETLGARDLAPGVGGRSDGRFVPLAVLLGVGEGCNGLARSDAGQILGLGSIVAGVQQGECCELAGEERRAQQGTTHFLEHDAELDEGEALAAVLLGDDETLETHLLGHLLPDRLVVTDLGVHELADGRLGGLLLHERSDEATELFLFLGEGKVHDRTVGTGSSHRQKVMCTHVLQCGHGATRSNDSHAPHRRP